MCSAIPGSSTSETCKGSNRTRHGTVHSNSVATIRLRTADWAALALLAFEVPSILFSQYRANSIGASEVVALSVLAYFALRLLVRVSPRAPHRPVFWTAGLAALVGLGGAWLATSGIFEFATGAEQLATVGCAFSRP